MARINPLDHQSANAQTQGILDAVKTKMGMVPNIIATMAHSPAVANAYLGFSQALSTGNLSPRLREQIALAVGQANNCGYCVSAHTALGKRAGLAEDSVLAARQGKSSDSKEQAALEFVGKVVEDRGNVTDEDVQRLLDSGYSPGDVGEIVANVALNLFTNYFNHVADTEIDFPLAPELAGV